jgi:hypothetical protein
LSIASNVSGWEAAFKPAVRIPETQRNIRFPAIEADDLEVRRDIDIERWKLGSECRERCDEHALRQAGWRIERQVNGQKHPIPSVGSPINPARKFPTSGVTS